MDPGMGFMVNSMVPIETEVPKLPPKSTLQLPDGFLEKPHVRNALKYITDDEQREKALKVAMVWKKKFAADKWKPVVAAIEATRKEDNVRSQDDELRCEDDDVHRKDNDLQLESAIAPGIFASPVTIAERPCAKTTTSAPAVPQATLTPTTTRKKLVRQHTATVPPPLRRMLAPLTPWRLRWDVITPGPVTPLSPTPSANSFSNWLRPKPAPPGEQTPMSTPVTALYVEPESPAVLGDIETWEAYNNVKKQIDSLARRHCLARFQARSTGCSDFIPATMIKPEDTLQAAMVMVDSHRLKLKDFILKDLPDRLQSRALTEVELRSHLCINDESDLEQQNDWINHITTLTTSQASDVDEHTNHVPRPTILAVSILDEQLAVLRDLRKQRESELAIRPEALAAAWAVKMLDDAECRARIEGEDSSSSSEGDDDFDEGYHYGNFLRTIKSEMSTSTSSGTLASMVDDIYNSDLYPTRSRSSTYQSASSRKTRDYRLSQRSSMSPSKENRWSERLSGLTASNADMHSSSLYPRSDLHIVTETIEEIPASDLSPEDRESRHRAPDLLELGHWAQELKKMEAMRAERQPSPTLHRRPPTRAGLAGSMEPRSPIRQMSVDSINTRMSPTRTMHSRFSSSSGSSTSTNMMKPLPRPLFLKHSPSASLSTSSDSKPTMLDHEYHQRKISKAGTHKRDTSKTSMADSVRRSQHLRSSSTVQVLTKHTSKQVEDDWMGELKRMENRERGRQAEERRRTVELLRGDTLIGEEDVQNENR